uniref:WD repeat domain 20b n=1 Tax=Neogobius melanostomus TaxID=47308 RepID=A0A8C6TC76_9GOBI
MLMLHGTMKSYFGGLLCVCWKDDLVTVWSFSDCRVIARGHGHKSWVSVVAFDHCTSSVEEGAELSGSDEDAPEPPADRARCRLSQRSSSESRPLSVTYRFGSVGQDTQLCLWDLTEDILFPTCPCPAHGLTPINSSTSGNSASSLCNSLPHPTPGGSSSFIASKFATLSLGDSRKDRHEKEHRRNHSLGNSRSSDKLTQLGSGSRTARSENTKTLGTTLCPRMEDVPLLEPLVCKKIAHERLTVLIFLEDCLVTGCQEGFICTWARPGRVVTDRWGPVGTL